MWSSSLLGCVIFFLCINGNFCFWVEWYFSFRGLLNASKDYNAPENA